MTQKQMLFYKIKSFLADAENLPYNSLAAASSDDLNDYEVGYTEMLKAYKEDRQTYADVSGLLSESITMLFGEDSKELKYFSRAVHKMELLQTHYEGYPRPDRVQRLVEEAKDIIASASNETSTGNVDTKTMGEVDEAIKFLINEGFSYGTDFSSHNAVDIAYSLIPSLLSKHPSLLGISCECEEYRYKIQNDESITCSCGCYSADEVEKEISFVDGKLVLEVSE